MLLAIKDALDEELARTFLEDYAREAVAAERNWNGNIYADFDNDFSWICEPCMCKKLGLIH